MSPYTSQNDWTWNCGAKNDIDVRATWGQNGDLTLQVVHLRGITYILDTWNARDGQWRQKSETKMLAEPTSDPVTFSGVRLVDHFADASTLWGKRFKIYSTLIIDSGEPGGALRIADHETRVEGCFSGNDPAYTALPGCPDPPVVPCP